MNEVRVCVMTGHGINADRELACAFELAGADVARVHLADLVADPAALFSYHILALPGGFSFGDHLGSGLVLASYLRRHIGETIVRFVEDGCLLIGICNGFQVLVKMGVLPNLSGDGSPEVSLVHNEQGVFVDRWVALQFDEDCPCVWTKGLTPAEAPIRHGEGRFVAKSEDVLDRLETEHLIAVRYAGTNPNGSEHSIAGITDRSGRVLGLMPHPEAFLFPQNHPRWTREHVATARGLEVFARGVEYAKEHLCRE